MNILLVDDDKDSRASMSNFLRELGHKIVESDNGEEALQLFTTDDFPMILSDIKMPKMSGIELLQALSALPSRQETDVVLYTGYGDMESAIDALRAGAYDYLLKPVNVEELAAITEQIEKHQTLQRENKGIDERINNKLITVTYEKQKEMEQLKEILMRYVGVKQIDTLPQNISQIAQLALEYHQERSIPVLIQGEEGTEKELLVRMIHYGSKGETAPFIDMNCASFTSAFFESELFGFEGESFADGLARRQKGKFDLAKGGTLFIDEVEEMPLELQRKLLRVIEEKEYYRVGGFKKIKADIRIVCGTHSNLEKRVKEGRFHKDLYYRLKTRHLVIPPLRQRKEDILPLANIFLERFNKQQKKHFRCIGNRAAMMLLNYAWPKNFRELRNIIELAVFMHDDVELKCEHLELLGNGTVEGHNFVSKVLDPINFLLPAEGFDLEEFNNNVIRKALDMHRGNKTETALYLGISRRSLYCRLKHVEELESENS